MATIYHDDNNIVATPTPSGAAHNPTTSSSIVLPSTSAPTPSILAIATPISDITTTTATTISTNISTNGHKAAASGSSTTNNANSTLTPGGAIREDAILTMNQPSSERARACIRISFASMNALAIALVIVAVVLASGNMATVKSNYADLGEARIIGENAQVMLETMLNAETGQRGFLLTNNQSYLEPYYDAIRTVNDTYATLLNSTASNTLLTSLVVQLPLWVYRKTNELGYTVTLALSGQSGRIAAIARVNTDVGKEFMDQIRSILLAIRQELDVISLNASEEANNSFTYLEVTLYGSLAVIAAVIFISCLAFLFSDSRAQQRTNDELRGLLAAARSATKVKSMFLASMSHEIRTPMNGVVAIAEELNNTPLTGEQRGMLDIIRSSADAMMRLINDILLFSKVEAAKFNLIHERFDLHGFLKPLGQISRVRASAKNIGFQLIMSQDTPRFLLTDSGRLRQVLVNLIDNALKFTHKGEVTLTVKLARIARLPIPVAPPAALAGNQPGVATSSPSATPPRGIDYSREVDVLFEVQDTGIGIPEAAQALIFQPFTQAETTTTRDYGGTGLGLTVCSELVKLMGGELSVRSQPGRGTCFYFTVKSSYVDPVEAEKEIREQATILDDDDEMEHKEMEVGVITTANGSGTPTDGTTIPVSSSSSTYASFAGSSHAGTLMSGAASGMTTSASPSQLTGIVIEMSTPASTSLVPSNASSPGREMVAGVHSSASSGTSVSTTDMTSPHGAVVSISSQQMAVMASLHASANGTSRTIALLPTLTLPPDVVVASSPSGTRAAAGVMTSSVAATSPAIARAPVFHADPSAPPDERLPFMSPSSSSSPSLAAAGTSSSVLSSPSGGFSSPSGVSHVGGGSTNSSPSAGSRQVSSSSIIPPSPMNDSQHTTLASSSSSSSSSSSHDRNGTFAPAKLSHPSSRSGSYTGSMPGLPVAIDTSSYHSHHHNPHHHGAGSASSSSSSGSSMVQMPLFDPPTVGTHAGSTPSFSSLSTGTGGGLRILVAEDNQINQRVLIRLLAHGRHRVVLCTNGKQAADAFLARPAAFDCIIMDIHMPVMDGLAATRLIRQHEQAAIHHQLRTAALVAPIAASASSSVGTSSISSSSSIGSAPLFPDIAPTVSNVESLPPGSGRRPSPQLSTATAAAASSHMDQMATIAAFPAPNASVWPRPYTRVPIIAATAGAADEDGQQCLAAGMDMVITKPIDRKALQRKLAKIPSRFSTFDSL